MPDPIGSAGTPRKTDAPADNDLFYIVDRDGSAEDGPLLCAMETQYVRQHLTDGVADDVEELAEDLTALEAVVATKCAKSANLSDVANAATARTNLGAAATLHTHAQSEVTNLTSDLAAKAPLASPALTGTPTAPTAAADTNTTQIATTAFVLSQISAAVAGLLDLKGSTNASGNPNYPAASKGDAYIISVAGKIGGASGKSVDVGDTVIASADNAGGTEASVGTSWFVLEHNLAGALLSANNLSDVANAATARSNLGAAATSHTHAQSDVTNLTSDLAAKAPLASPTFTGTPAAPTAAPGTNTTQLASTAFVTAAVAAGGGGGASISTPQVAYVEVDGDNGTAEIGNPAKPFAGANSAYAAIVSSGNNGVIQLGVGTAFTGISQNYSPLVKAIRGRGIEATEIGTTTLTFPTYDGTEYKLEFVDVTISLLDCAAGLTGSNGDQGPKVTALGRNYRLRNFEVHGANGAAGDPENPGGGGGPGGTLKAIGGEVNRFDVRGGQPGADNGAGTGSAGTAGTALFVQCLLVKNGQSASDQYTDAKLSDCAYETTFFGGFGVDTGTYGGNATLP